jgi:hypothetical protein
VSQACIAEDDYRNADNADARRSIHSSPILRKLQTRIIALQGLGRGGNEKGSLGESAERVQYGKETQAMTKTLRNCHSDEETVYGIASKVLILKNKLDRSWYATC